MAGGGIARWPIGLPAWVKYYLPRPYSRNPTRDLLDRPMHADQSQQVVAAVAAIYGAIISGAGAMEGIPALSWTGVIALAGGIYGYAELRGRLKAREEAQERADSDRDEHKRFVEAALMRLALSQGVDLSDLKR